MPGGAWIPTSRATRQGREGGARRRESFPRATARGCPACRRAPSGLSPRARAASSSRPCPARSPVSGTHLKQVHMPWCSRPGLTAGSPCARRCTAQRRAHLVVPGAGAFGAAVQARHHVCVPAVRGAGTQDVNLDAAGRTAQQRPVARFPVARVQSFRAGRIKRPDEVASGRVWRRRNEIAAKPLHEPLAEALASQTLRKRGACAHRQRCILRVQTAFSGPATGRFSECGGGRRPSQTHG